MASTYTDRNGIELMAFNEKKNSWGTETNTNLQIIEQALDGSVTKTATATLTSTDGAVNEAQSRWIISNGSSAVTITLHGEEKWYFARNLSLTQNATLTNGGQAVVITPGMDALVYTDGTDCYLINLQRRWVELQTRATTSGTSWNFGGTSAAILYRYSELLLQFNGVSHSGAGSADLRIGIGSPTPTNYYVLGSFGASATVYGALQTSSRVTDTTADTNFGAVLTGAVADLSALNVATSATAACIPYFVNDADATLPFTIDFNGETGDAGSIVLYGR